MSDTTSKSSKTPIATASTAKKRNKANTGVSEPSWAAKYRRLEALVTLLTRQEGGMKGASLLVAGSAGVGKSEVVRSTLVRAGVLPEDVVFARGHASGGGIVELVYRSSIEAKEAGRRKFVILDDILENMLASSPNLLKSLLEPSPVKMISYLSSRLPSADIPRQFEIGTELAIICISNLNFDETKNPHALAIRSRCFFVSLHLAVREIISYTEVNIVGKDYAGSTLNDRKFVHRRFANAALNCTTPNAVSLRTYFQLLDLYLAGEDLDEHLEIMLPSDDGLILLRKCVRKADDVTGACALWCKATGKSVRSFWYVKKAAERAGLLE